MSPSAGFVRWSAVAAMAGGALSILFAFIGENSWAHVPVDAARYVLLVVGIAGIYLHLRGSRGFGLLGAVAFYVCLFVFAILDLGIIVDEALERSYIALGPVRGPVRGPLLVVGLVLFGLATLREGSLPRGGSWLLIAAALTNVLGVVAMIVTGGTLGAWIFILPTVLFGLGWGWLGYGLWSESEISSRQASRGSELRRSPLTHSRK
jgi:hypothetical protein